VGVQTVMGDRWWPQSADSVGLRPGPSTLLRVVDLVNTTAQFPQRSVAVPLSIYSHSQKLVVIIALFSTLVDQGCDGESPTEHRLATTPAASIGAQDRAVLTVRREFWRSYGALCTDAGGFPSKDHCDDGDMTLFNGLLCASGESKGCDAVARSQGGDGRWWRSPARVGGNRGQKNSFSRDMTMGVLLYLAQTRDVDAALDWLGWIETNRACAIENPFTDGCFLRGPHRVCRDDEDYRCTITPAVWAAMYHVWRHLELAPTTEMEFHAAYVDPLADPLASITPAGYQSHLVGVSAYLEQVLSRTNGPGAELAERLADDQPRNPFFVYLRDGGTLSVAQQVLALCPHPRDGLSAVKHQWSWERDQDSEAWKESMGWDCVFMANLLLAQQ